MPKQGQFAKSTRRQTLNQFRVKRHNNVQQIDSRQFTDFLLVRFALTAKKHLSGVTAETAQRLLIELVERLIAGQNDLKTIMTNTMVELQSRVPWQFGQQVIASWPILQPFLLKEVPAVPLKEPVLLSNQLSVTELTTLVAQLLAQQATAITFLQRPVNDIIRQQTTAKLKAVICPDDQIVWSQVAALFKPFPFSVDEQLDDGTKKWLQQLMATDEK